MYSYGRIRRRLRGGPVDRPPNFDPVAVLLQGMPEQAYEATRYCLQNGGARLFSGAECEIPDGTPHENLLAQTRALQDCGGSE